MKKRFIKASAVLGAISAVLLAYCFFVLYTGKGIDCPLHYFTGLECPGCGNTRAAVALLRLDIKSALEYNLLIFAEILYIIWAALYTSAVYVKAGKYELNVKPSWANILFLVLFAGWGIVRNII